MPAPDPLLSLLYPNPARPLGLSITPQDIFPVISHKLIYDTISKFIVSKNFYSQVMPTSLS